MLTIDEARGEVTVFGPDGRRAVHPMDTAEAFEVLSAAWLRSGRDVKYAYGFTWMGRPVIRMPEDMIRIQELIWRVRPDVIVETGVGHGGSLVFYATLFAAMGHGRVIGVDPDIEPHNRVALGAHPLAARISLVEGSTAATDTLATVRSMIMPGERVLVVLESSHGHAHVAAELEAYAPLVARGSYIVSSEDAPDDMPRGRKRPLRAAEAFAAEHPDFVLEEPWLPFNEGKARTRVTQWPVCLLRRVLGGPI